MRHSQIFLIDDDLDVLTRRAVLLRRAGFDPIRFSSAKAALGHDEFAQADLVICDLYSRRVSPAHRSIAGSRTDHERRRHRWAAGRRRRLSEKARLISPAADALRVQACSAQSLHACTCSYCCFFCDTAGRDRSQWWPRPIDPLAVSNRFRGNPHAALRLHLDGHADDGTSDPTCDSLPDRASVNASERTGIRAHRGTAHSLRPLSI